MPNLEPSRRFTESRTRVRYKETDRMGIAHHSNYVVWFEMGRTDLCREAGITYREIEEHGYLLVVTEIHCRYLVPYGYDDEVVIRTSLANAASRAFRFAYELRDGAGTKLHATGSSSHLWLDRATRRPVVAPSDITIKFESFM